MSLLLGIFVLKYHLIPCKSQKLKTLTTLTLTRLIHSLVLVLVLVLDIISTCSLLCYLVASEAFKFFCVLSMYCINSSMLAKTISECKQLQTWLTGCNKGESPHQN